MLIMAKAQPEPKLLDCCDIQTLANSNSQEWCVSNPISKWVLSPMVALCYQILRFLGFASSETTSQLAWSVNTKRREKGKHPKQDEKLVFALQEDILQSREKEKQGQKSSPRKQYTYTYTKQFFSLSAFEFWSLSQVQWNDICIFYQSNGWGWIHWESLETGRSGETSSCQQFVNSSEEAEFRSHIQMLLWLCPQTSLWN